MERGRAWRLAGRAGVGAGAAVFIVSLHLPYIDTATRSASAWDLTTRQPAILTVIAGLALVLAALDLRLEAPGVAMATAGLSLYAFGQYFPIGARTYGAYGAGLWVGTACALLMSVGSLATLIGYRIEAASPAAEEDDGGGVAGRPERRLYEEEIH